ncbi:hypothetical protein M409DRAFT_18401 [Zasmidium cellare ATCC 36951]|uniref:26S proteasome complex subunit SEM1 n=1 Tax=Zasmidium cellare ATCC 36951 TaxID=1080233 RepID=A0A6A6CVS5_ZASCE|nr:uncharacterized protein M409DRAFT_18401 [Zasmidium cellare ATCC 36951]KAF2171287.1 hypothetical protein M409DRAFT_18401 [Zasmidium cellare ATCC 36951]
MSGAAAGDAATKQATVSDNKDTSKPLQANKPAAQLEEDDEFEDFPVEDWAKEEEVGAQTNGSSHLWEESWDDDDTTDEFSVQLKEELKKMGKS